MKYTRSETGEVIDVKGCTNCPHMERRFIDLQPLMYCVVPVLVSGGTHKPRNKKLIGRWTGAYHESCPLAYAPENVPAVKGVKK
jgi:hypothetical protein